MAPWTITLKLSHSVADHLNDKCLNHFPLFPVQHCTNNYFTVSHFELDLNHWHAHFVVFRLDWQAEMLDCVSRTLNELDLRLLGGIFQYFLMCLAKNIAFNI